MSSHFPATRREAGSSSSRSQVLLEQAGYIRRAGSSGVYSLLPLGWRVHDKICRIVFDTMEEFGVQNVQLPILQAQELWQQTGRWDGYTRSKTMFTTTEQHSGAIYGLAPTAEELVTFLVQTELTSWRELPIHLHQIGPKFRDELRPRSGLLRTREFVMSDAYSFDRDEEGMRQSFEMYRNIYNAIFSRVGLPRVISVQADSGAIGGQGSAEFMAVSEAGEDTLLTCDNCDYGANVEKAASVYPTHVYSTDLSNKRVEATPNIRSVDDLTEYFDGLPSWQMIKTLVLTVDEGLDSQRAVAVCIRGDLNVNEVKLRNHLGAQSVEPASAFEVTRVTGAEVGFAGPLGLDGADEIIFDSSTATMTNFLCGMNKTDTHALDVNFERDLPRPERFVELHTAEAGHGCANCDAGSLLTSRGIEIGHIFMLQQGYAKSLEVEFTEDDGTRHVPWMGCYGIGTTRLLQAIVEQCNDEKGIVWPEAVAPYEFHVVVTRPQDAATLQLGETLCSALGDRNCMLDVRRTASVGVKFNDAELIGAPWRITVGRRSSEGFVELERRGGASVEVEIGDLGSFAAVVKLAQASLR
jgi:prolyl-tRNA synthetase